MKKELEKILDQWDMPLTGQQEDIIKSIQKLTEQKIAEELHKRQNQQFLDLVENVPDVICRFDLNLRCMYVNPAIETITGKSRKKFIHRKLKDLMLDEKMLFAWRDRLQEVFKTGRKINFEFSYETPIGLRYYQALIVPEFDVSEKIQSALVISRDISDLKESMRKWMNSENKYRQLFEQNPIPAWVVDAKEFKFLEMNLAATNYFECHGEEIEKKSFFDFFKENDILNIHTSFKKLMDSECKKIGLFEQIMPNKSIRQVEIFGYSVSYNNHQAFLILGIDVSLSHFAQEELRQTKDFLEAIVENIPDMIFVKDALELRFVKLNSASEKILGYNRENLIGKNDYDFFPKHEADFFTSKDRQVLNSGKMLDILEESIKTKEGQRVLHTKKIPINDSKGNPKYLLGISEDITDKAISKSRMNNILAEQEKIVQNRTHELVYLNEQLQSEISKRKRIGYEVQLKNIEITESIQYARKIQQAILPDKNEIRASFSDSFVLYIPRDIVSGDFYWFHREREKVFIAAADCTGHGVPAAFLAIMGNDFLNDIIIEKKEENPSRILSQLDKKITNLLRQKSNQYPLSDGMDIAFCVIDYSRHELTYSGAFCPLYHVRNNELIIHNDDRVSVGGHIANFEKTFSETKIDIVSGDQFYIFSDGYISQFGGEKSRKFMKQRFNDLILSISSFSMPTQELLLIESLQNWKSENDQVDDILVAGFKI